MKIFRLSLDPRSKAIFPPSGDHRGLPTQLRAFVIVETSAFLLSASQVRISVRSDRVEANAIVFPSGENCGAPSVLPEGLTLVHFNSLFFSLGASRSTSQML